MGPTDYKIVDVGDFRLVTRKGTNDAAVAREVILGGLCSYKEFIHPEAGDVWLDVGGHIGSFALSIFRSVRQVVCCEPEPSNWEILNLNLVRQRAQNVIPLHVAVVGNADRTRSLYVHPGPNCGVHSLIVKGAGVAETVLATNVGYLVDKCHVNKIKLDCEGAEYEILMGLDARLWPRIKEVVLEYHHGLLLSIPSAYADLEELFHRYFRTVVMEGRGRQLGQSIFYAGDPK